VGLSLDASAKPLPVEDCGYRGIERFLSFVPGACTTIPGPVAVLVCIGNGGNKLASSERSLHQGT